MKIFGHGGWRAGKNSNCTHKEYLLASFIVESAGGRDAGTIISYTLVFNDQAEMLVQERRQFQSPFKTDASIFIPPEQFDKYSINGISLRRVVATKLDEILPNPN